MIIDIEKKLNGTIPINKFELLELVNSWGRKENCLTNEDIIINNCDANEKYDLSNLDVSQIDDLSYVFRYSYYNGDLSKWNVSNCTILERTFSHSDFNNDSISNWDVSNVEDMDFIFFNSKFNGNVSNWNISKVITMESGFDFCNFDGDISKWNFNKEINCDNIFDDNKNFNNKYNCEKILISNTNDFLFWFENNREKMRELNISKENILDFFSFDSNLEKGILE